MSDYPLNVGRGIAVAAWHQAWRDLLDPLRAAFQPFADWITSPDVMALLSLLNRPKRATKRTHWRRRR